MAVRVRRFRNAAENEENLRVLAAALKPFQGPLLDMFKKLTGAVTASVSLASCSLTSPR